MKTSRTKSGYSTGGVGTITPSLNSCRDVRGSIAQGKRLVNLARFRDFATSAARESGSGRSWGTERPATTCSANQIQQPIPRAHERQKPRPAIVQIQRRTMEPQVGERVIDRLAGPTRAEPAAEVGRQRHAVAGVADRVVQPADLAGVRHHVK